MKTLFAAALTLSSIAAPALAQNAPYKALGTEPFWSLTIDARTMKFEAPGQRPVTVATPKVIHGFAGEIYRTRRIGVNTVHKSCSDGMSDRTYPDTVQVTVDGRRYEGCGGAPVGEAPRSEIEGSWRIETIAGRPAVRRTTVTVTFNAGQMNGNTGCNMFNGSYRFGRGFLSAGPLATTRRACSSRYVNLQEQTLLKLFGQRLSVSSMRNGNLRLTGNGGSLVLVRERGRR